MYKGKFYNFKDINGRKMMVNINNIASIISLFNGIEITLNVKDKNDNFIVFTATDEYNKVTESIYNMDQSQGRNLEVKED